MTGRLFCILVFAPVLTLAQPPATNAPKGAYTNIELTVYAVSGLAQSNQAGVTAEELPDDLGSTIKQLRGVFMYKSYKLIDEFTLRGRNGYGAEIGGEIPYFSGGQYDFKYRNAQVGNESPRLIHINGLRLEITRRFGLNSMPTVVALVATDLDLREGQKTVVGKSAVNGTDALFLVIVPKVIE